MKHISKWNCTCIVWDTYSILFIDKVNLRPDVTLLNITRLKEGIQETGMENTWDSGFRIYSTNIHVIIPENLAGRKNPLFIKF